MDKLIAIGLALLLSSNPVCANDNARLVGTWRLTSFDLEFQSGQPSRPFMDQRWVGYTIFTPEGRTMSVWEAEGRQPANTDPERAALLRSINALTGTYNYAGGTGIVEVDVSSNPASKGKQTRGYTLEGARLMITTPWAPSQTVAGSPVARFVIRMERVAP